MLVHNRLKRIREKRGLKQSEVCRGIVSASHYSNIEACRFTPSLDTMMLLAERLDIPHTYLTNTNSFNASLEDLLIDYEKLIELRDVNRIEQLMSKSAKNFQYIESIIQEYHFNLLKFLEFAMTNKIEDAIIHYEENLSDFDTASLNYLVYKKYLYASGLYNYYKRNYTESIRFYLETIDLDKSYKSRLYYNISLCFYIQKLYSDALFYAKSANELYLKEHKWDRVGDCYNLIAVVHLEMGDLRKAEKYIQKGFDIANISSKGIESKLYHNLALIRKAQGDFEGAIDYTQKAITLKSALNENDLFISYRVILTIYSEREDITNLKNTLMLAENSVATPLESAIVMYFDAQLNWLNGHYPQYEKLMSEAIKVFGDYEDWTSLMQATKHHSLFLENNHKYKKALELQKLCSFALENITRGK